VKKIIAGTLGNCVHVAGIMNYLNLAEKENYDTDFIGIGKSVDEIIMLIHEKKPNIVALSYRLTPEPLYKILEELRDKINKNNIRNITWLFGGTEPTGLVAKEYQIFDKIFDSTEDIDEVIAYLKGKNYSGEES